MIHLVVTLKGREIGRFDVEGERVGIGRHPDNAVQIDSAGVSRYHCALHRTPGTNQWVVEDLGSSNGTFVNGARVERSQLRSRDALSIGPFAVSVRVDPGANKGLLTTPGRATGPIAVRSAASPRAREEEATEKGFLVLQNRSGPEILLTRDLFQIGAAPELDLHLEGPAKSVLIVRGYGGFQIVNVAPGVVRLSVDGRSITDRAWLRDGSVLQIGELEAVFQTGLPAPDEATMCITLSDEEARQLSAARLPRPKQL